MSELNDVIDDSPMPKSNKSNRENSFYLKNRNPGSSDYVCIYGHNKHRDYKKGPCSGCHGIKHALEGGKSLQSEYPTSNKEWGNNGKVTPRDLTSGSSFEANFKCHICTKDYRLKVFEWSYNYSSTGAGCPKCSAHLEIKKYQSCNFFRKLLIIMYKLRMK